VRLRLQLTGHNDCALPVGAALAGLGQRAAAGRQAGGPDSEGRLVSCCSLLASTSTSTVTMGSAALLHCCLHLQRRTSRPRPAHLKSPCTASAYCGAPADPKMLCARTLMDTKPGGREVSDTCSTLFSRSWVEGSDTLPPLPMRGMPLSPAARTVRSRSFTRALPAAEAGMFR
jgi:hypothetical protein